MSAGSAENMCWYLWEEMNRIHDKVKHVEQKMLKAISKMPPTLRPSSKNVFVEQAIKTYIDSLVKDKVITF